MKQRQPDQSTPQRSARLRAGLSLAEADALTSIGLARLSVIERQPVERLTQGIRTRLAEAYGITVEELIGEAVPNTPKHGGKGKPTR